MSFHFFVNFLILLNLFTRIPTTNGETPLNSSNHHSSQSPQNSPKPYRTSPSPTQPKLEIRTMRELLADDMRDSQFSQQEQNENNSKQNLQSCEKNVEKNERESPFESTSQQQQQQQSCSISIPLSPVNLSNDSNSGDQKKFDKESQSE